MTKFYAKNVTSAEEAVKFLNDMESVGNKIKHWCVVPNVDAVIYIYTVFLEIE